MKNCIASKEKFFIILIYGKLFCLQNQKHRSLHAFAWARHSYKYLKILYFVLLQC